MSKVLIVLLAFLLIGFTAAQVTKFEPGESLPDGEYAVFRILDGDTLTVKVPVDEVPVNEAPMSGGSVSGGAMSGGAMPAAPEMVERSVRFIGFDTPEIAGNQPFNKEATAYAVAALEGQVVTLTAGSVPIDRFGRALAYVTLPDGSDYGLGVISAGLARLYVGEVDNPHAPLYYAALEGAFSARKGLHEGGFFVDRNCSSFLTQGESQAFFKGAMTAERRDAHRLDPNADGVPCERLPK